MEDLDDFCDLIFIAGLAYAANEEFELEERRSERRWWVRELNLSRDFDGYYALNFKQMQDKDPEHFFKITRMKPVTFELLRSLIEPQLEKSSIRTPVSPSCRLFLTLMYLSQGVPRQVLAWMFRIGYTTVGTIIYDTCHILWAALMPLYIEQPSEAKWKEISKDFETLWNLPNCISAIDSKHVNVKRHHSIVLLAACDANYIFTAVDIGAYGSQSDGGVLAQSFGKQLLNGTLNIPPSALLPNSNISLNHFLVSDAAFPLRTNLMRPYPGRLLDDKKTYFNKRLSRARRVIENAFGILVARWRILQNTLNMLPSNADRIIKASVVLHNFVKLNDVAYSPEGYVDTYDSNDNIVLRGRWRLEANPLPSARPLGSNNSTRHAFQMRDQLKDYLYANKI